MGGLFYFIFVYHEVESFNGEEMRKKNFLIWCGNDFKFQTQHILLPLMCIFHSIFDVSIFISVLIRIKNNLFSYNETIFIFIRVARLSPHWLQDCEYCRTWVQLVGQKQRHLIIRFSKKFSSAALLKLLFERMHAASSSQNFACYEIAINRLLQQVTKYAHKQAPVKILLPQLRQ